MKIAGNNFAVIGGAGFIGSHICEQLVEAGANKIFVIDNLERGKLSNLRKVKDKIIFRQTNVEMAQLLQDLLVGHNIDGVFHLAASWLDECYHNPRKGLEVNIRGTFNVLDACKNVDSVQRLIFSSSASVYGDQVINPIEETAPYRNKNFYGATKIAGEHLFRSYYFQHGLKGACLRYMNVYGPRMDTKGEYVGLIPKVLECLHNKKPITVAGDGGQIFDFIYVDDVARANIKAMESDCKFDYFNVGTEIGTSIISVVERLIQLVDRNLAPDNIVYDQSLVKPGSVTKRVGSINKASTKLGFRAEILLHEGLRRTVEWWKRENSK